MEQQIVRIKVGNETRYGSNDDTAKDFWGTIADDMVKRAGGGIPEVDWVPASEARAEAVPLPQPVTVVAPVAPVAILPTTETPKDDLASLERLSRIVTAKVEPAPVAPQATPIVRGVTISADGAERSNRDLLAATMAGFAMDRTIYERGTMVLEDGVKNARRSRVDFESQTLVSVYCHEFKGKIHGEHREDYLARVANVQMAEDGSIYVVSESGDATPHLQVEERAFPSLVGDLGMPAGAGQYLSQVWPELRAENINRWTTRIADREEPALASGEIKDKDTKKLVLRTRNGSGPRSVFAVVSPSYAAFDVNKIAEAIELATPAGARGTVTYDGYQARFVILFQTTVPPEDFVCGEFFRAGVVIKTDDTGGGSLRGNSIAFQNRCLNMIVIDEANVDVFRIRHIGKAEELARKFREGFQTAMGKIDHFIKAWGYACRDDLRAYLPAEAKGMTMAEAFPGFANGVIERDLVPVRSRNRVEVVKQLTRAFTEDHSSATQSVGLSRAALANAFTRYAHTVPQSSPWVEDEIQRAAGALVQSNGAIPWTKIDLSAK